MCSITLLNNEGDQYDFVDCNGNTGQVSIVLIKELPQQQSGLYSATGTSTEGTPFTTTIVIPNADRVNPTKIFKWVAKKLKETLCPNCM